MKNLLFIAFTFLVSLYAGQCASAEESLEHGIATIKALSGERTWRYWVFPRNFDPGFAYRFIDENNSEFWAKEGYRGENRLVHFTMEQWGQFARFPERVKTTTAALTINLPDKAGMTYSGFVRIDGWWDYEGIFHPLNVSGFSSRLRGTEIIFIPQ